MNMKTPLVLLTLCFSFQVFGEEPEACVKHAEYAGAEGYTKEEADRLAEQCEAQRKVANDKARTNATTLKDSGMTGVVDGCNAILKNRGQGEETDDIKQCLGLSGFSGGNLTDVDVKGSAKQSMDGKILCVQRASYTVDYEACLKALNHYNYVVAAEKAMELQQQIRTDLKNQAIQKEAVEKAQKGDLQGGALQAGADSHDHMAKMNQEKVAAYGLAIGALVNAYTMIPSEKKAIAKCEEAKSKVIGLTAEHCQKAIAIGNKPSILANQNAKVALASAIAEFTAKATVAGFNMKKHENASDQIEQVKNQFGDSDEDLMMERCVFNPTDPLCAKPGTRTPGQSFAGGDFGFTGDGSNNSFNMGPESGDSFEVGAETNLDGTPVASINSPFADEAKKAQGILDPAGAAQMQPGSGGGGGGGGAGGGMGGGGASLGNDLAGADADGNKEASIKSNKVSGVYQPAGGGGYKGINKGKEDANPFASLFDAKGTAGGIEEDRSIASGDIDGKASGLFQKISKRYGQIQADKRIEANNLE